MKDDSALPLEIREALERQVARKRAAEARGDITYCAVWDDDDGISLIEWRSRDLEEVMHAVGKGSPDENAVRLSINTVRGNLYEEIAAYEIVDGRLREVQS